jgi:hypothetical protein
LVGIDEGKTRDFDRTNAYLGGLVFLGAFIVYAMTVQRTFSFWDCGELIGSCVIAGIPHPPGFPLLVMISRIFAAIPFVGDVSYRVNYVSVIASSVTALFSYLIAVRLIQMVQGENRHEFLNRVAAYVGGIAGAFLVAFSSTNWGNSVEAETYAGSLALSTGIFWLTLRYHERRNEAGAIRIMILAMYLAILGIGIHMTVYLVVPVCAIFFILNREAQPRDYLLICLFAFIELLMIIVFANGRGGPGVFKVVSVILGLVMFIMLYQRIRWGILVAIAATSSLMISFSLYFLVLPVALLAVIALAYVVRRFEGEMLQPGYLGAVAIVSLMMVVGYLSYEEQYSWILPTGMCALAVLSFLALRKVRDVQWLAAAAILVVGYIGFSVHYYVPIRSSLNPRIDENHAARNWSQFEYFLDRKQYGQTSMVDRMFDRRGEWSNQFGRHANMGFWSYFEEQYGPSGWSFAPFFILGMLGVVVAIRKRIEVGLPFLTLIILGSIGLVLYMNFADGTRYSSVTGDAYLEVRNRDYFFTPAFVFFGIAIGVGIAALIGMIRRALSESGYERYGVYAASALVFLPLISLNCNYHPNDRSRSFLPLNYAKSLLDTCKPNAIFFTVGDNDTFPTWCLQEAYGYRKDVRVVNLSLLNTDWYVRQMKEHYGVPISLTDEQILWDPYELPGGQMTQRPAKPFADRPRKRMTYLHQQFSGMTVQDMMVDEIVIENKWQSPIYFSAPPYAESPLKLREHAVVDGQLYRLEREPDSSLVDIEHSYDLYMNVYRFDGMENSKIFRDENATGVMDGVAMSSLRIVDELFRAGDTTRAVALCTHLTKVIPEFFQAYATLADLATLRGDSLQAIAWYQQFNDTLTGFLASNPGSQYYLQDLGTAKYQLGTLKNDTLLMEEGLKLLREGWAVDMNNALAFRKLVSVLNQANLRGEMRLVTQQYAAYKRNLADPIVQSILGGGGS